MSPRARLWMATPLVIGLGIWMAAAPAAPEVRDRLPSAGKPQDCKALAAYRDTDLLSQWLATREGLTAVAQHHDGIESAVMEFKEGRSSLQRSTAVLTVLRVTKIGANLVENSINAVMPLRAGTSKVLDAVNAYKAAAALTRDRHIDFGSADALMDVAKEISTTLSEINSGYAIAHDLASDSAGLMDDLGTYSEIDRQLTSQMTAMKAKADALAKQIARMDGIFREMEAAKEEIDKLCGGVYGCPTPGSGRPSPPRTVLCLAQVDAALCPNCKAGWRHRCDAQGKTGVAADWTPIEECYSSELRSARRGNRDAESGTSFEEHAQALTVSSKAQLARDVSPAGHCADEAPSSDDLVEEMRRAMVAGGADASRLPAGVNQSVTIQGVISQAGSIDRAIEAARAQIASNRSNIAMGDCSATRQHQAACRLNEISIRHNERFLSWLMCHKSKMFR